MHWKEAHAGHFKHGRADFAVWNIHVQCAGCNTYLHGNLGLYAVKLIKEIGVENVDALILEANTRGNNYSIEELETIIQTCEEKLNKIKNAP